MGGEGKRRSGEKRRGEEREKVKPTIFQTIKILSNFNCQWGGRNIYCTC